MCVSTQTFFNGLCVCPQHYHNRFREIGVKNRFFYDEDDLKLIQQLPVQKYKTALVVNRARSLLEEINVKAD